MVGAEVLGRHESLHVEVSVGDSQQEVVRTLDLLLVVFALLDIFLEVFDIVVPLGGDVLVVLLF